jgi:hypothetical protein
MRSKLGLGAVLLLMVAGMIAAPLPATADPGDDSGLGEEIDRQLRADGPWFTPEEQAVIAQACGYAPGEWDGFELNMRDDTLICTNGRRADGPEVRRVLRAAEPRIEARVERVMASAEVQGRIERITERATAAAMRSAELRMADFDFEFDIEVADDEPGDDDRP